MDKDYKEISILVDALKADEIQKKQVIEIATRCRNGQFEYFEKAYLSHNNNNFYNWPISPNPNNGNIISKIPISYANLFFSEANLIVNIAGFLMVRNQMEKENIKLTCIDKKIDRLLNLEIATFEEVKQIKDELNRYREMKWNEFITDFKMTCGKWEYNEDIDVDKLEKSLNTLKDYIEIFLVEKINSYYNNKKQYDFVVNRIDTALAIYDILFYILNCRHFSTKNRSPSTYNDLLKLYDDLIGTNIDSYLSRLLGYSNYSFFVANNHYIDKLKLEYEIAQKKEQIKLKKQTIEDHNNLIRLLGNDEYHIFMNRLQNDFIIPKISNQYNKDENECKKILFEEVDM